MTFPMESQNMTQALRATEDSLAEMLTLARHTLKDPSFGSDVQVLAKMTAIPGLSGLLEEELLHLARLVAKRQRRQLPS